LFFKINDCAFFFQIIYVDSLAIPNVQIPATIPRIATWTKNLLAEVIKLDTNGDGSFGKLKVLVKTKPDYFLNISQTTIFFIITQTITNPFFQLKSSAHSVVQDSPFQMDDIYSFVSSKAPRDLAPDVCTDLCPFLFFFNLTTKFFLFILIQ